jgi:hypothetical protein
LLRDKHYKKQLSVADGLSGFFDLPTPNVSTNQAAPSITLTQVNKPKSLLHWCHTELLDRLMYIFNRSRKENK